MHVVEFPGNALALPRSSLVRFWVAALCRPSVWCERGSGVAPGDSASAEERAD